LTDEPANVTEITANAMEIIANVTKIIANVVEKTAKIGLAANLLNLKDLMRTKENCLRDGNKR